MRRAAPYVLFGALTLACFWRFLFFGWTLYDVRTLEGHLGMESRDKPGWFESNRPSVDRGDTILSLAMLNRIYSQGLHQGELRLWNPNLFCGYPLYNNLLLHPFYPPNLVLHAALPSGIAYDLNLLLHFFFSGAAMYWLLRGMGRSDVAATAGGVLWMLIGYNSFWFSTGTSMGTSVFAPLALLGIHLGLTRRDARPLALGGLAMGLAILGSHGQHALHTLIFLSLWLLVSWIRDRESRPFLWRGGAVFIGATLGVGMAAILTQMDSVRNGLRLPGEDAGMHYASPWAVLTYAANLPLGKVCYAPDGLLRSEFTIYAGVAGTVLAIAGAVRGFRDPWIRFLTIFAVVALLVAFVEPLARLALQIPFLNLSMPARWVYVFGFCAALLAARGLDAMREDPAKTVRVAALSGGAILVLLACFLQKGALAETIVGFGLAAAWVFTASRWARFSLAFCFLALIVDLLPNFVFHNRHAEPRALVRGFLAMESLRDPMPSVPEIEPWRATGSVRIEGAPADANGWTVSIGNNLLALHGVEAVMGYESIAPLSTVRYCVAISGRRSIMGSGRVLAVINLKSRLLDIANMRTVYMPFVYPDPEPRFTRKTSLGPMTVYENSAALPRAFVVSRAVRAADENEAARLLEDPGLDPRTTVVLQEDELPRTGEGGGSVRWKVRDTDRMELTVNATSDAILVVSDTHYPGWEAEVDGVPSPILRANLAFRAVAVPAGTHTVTMRFRPASARYGLIATALSILWVLHFCYWKRISS